MCHQSIVNNHEFVTIMAKKPTEFKGKLDCSKPGDKAQYAPVLRKGSESPGLWKHDVAYCAKLPGTEKTPPKTSRPSRKTKEEKVPTPPEPTKADKKAAEKTPIPPAAKGKGFKLSKEEMSLLDESDKKQGLAYLKKMDDTQLKAFRAKAEKSPLWPALLNTGKEALKKAGSKESGIDWALVKFASRVVAGMRLSSMRKPKSAEEQPSKPKRERKPAESKPAKPASAKKSKKEEKAGFSVESLF